MNELMTVPPVQIGAWLACLAFTVMLANGLVKLWASVRGKPAPGEISERLTKLETISDLHAEKFQGTRPAVGYPSLPDLSLNFLLDQLLDFSQIGIKLTEHGMMQPQASVSGLMLAHPQSHYFSVGQICEDQLTDYAQRRGMPVSVLRPYLASSL